MSAFSVSLNNDKFVLLLWWNMFPCWFRKKRYMGWIIFLHSENLFMWYSEVYRNVCLLFFFAKLCFKFELIRLYPIKSLILQIIDLELDVLERMWRMTWNFNLHHIKLCVLYTYNIADIGRWSWFLSWEPAVDRLHESSARPMEK